MFTLDASRLRDFQDCNRRGKLADEWRPLKWRPKTLFDACLRWGIVEMSQGAPAEECAAKARVQFTQTAASPGLDMVGRDPYVATKDWCAMLDTVLRSVARTLTVKLTDALPVQLNPTIEWQVTAHIDNTGRLHRWITLDSWGVAETSRELHGWHCIGDMATAMKAMTIHVIEIGSESKGRRASPWARSWKHPVMSQLQMHFRRKDGKRFNGWKPLYLADTKIDADAWVEQMWREGAAQLLMHDMDVALPPLEVCLDIQRQIVLEAVRIKDMLENAYSYATLPMSRGACDGLIPCPYQEICYAPSMVDISKLGLYRNRGQMTCS